MGRVVLLVLLFAATLVVADNEILDLPGAPAINFKQYHFLYTNSLLFLKHRIHSTNSFIVARYAGYINVNNETGRNLFYWFTESQNKPSSDPVVLVLIKFKITNNFNNFINNIIKVVEWRTRMLIIGRSF